MADWFPARDDAVSPVVGVVLLVGITVLLVALVFVVVNGTAGETPSQTQVDIQQSSFSFEFTRNVSYKPKNAGACGSDGSCRLDPYKGYKGDMLNVTYESGSDLPAENIRIRVNGGGVKYINESWYLQDKGGGQYHSSYTLAEATGTETLRATDEFTLVTIYSDYIYNPDPYHPGSRLRNVDSVQIIWEGNGESQIISEWSGPGG